MNKRSMIIAGILLIAAVMGYYRLHHAKEAGDNQAVWVQAVKVKQVAMTQEAHAIGALTAQSVEITPEVSGHISNLLFKDGAAVKKGDGLIQLDDAIYKAKYSSSKAKLIYSDNNFNRMSLLGKKGVVSKQAIDQAVADLKEKQADVDESAVMLSKMKLVAPFDGVVGKSKVNPGDYVNVGQNLVTLTDTKHLRIEYNLPEKYLGMIKLGQTVTITSTAYPNKKFTGSVTFISPTINTDTRSIALYADIDNSQNQLASGMFVNIVQSLGVEDNALVIPARSLVPVLDGEQVFKIVDGKAYSVSVKHDNLTDTDAEIISGLTKDDVVVTDGQMKLKNGMPVKIKS